MIRAEWRKQSREVLEDKIVAEASEQVKKVRRNKVVSDESENEAIFRLIGGTKASLACNGDSSWEGLKVLSPYPLTRSFNAQRKAALKASDTLYCYDLPALFEAAVEKQWSDAVNNGRVEGSVQAAYQPFMVMYTTELFVQKKNGVGSSESWTM